MNATPGHASVGLWSPQHRTLTIGLVLTLTGVVVLLAQVHRRLVQPFRRDFTALCLGFAVYSLTDNTSYFDGALWMSSVDGHWEIYANQYTCSETNFMWLLLPIDTTGRSPNSLSKSEFWRQRSFAGGNR